MRRMAHHSALVAASIWASARVLEPWINNTRPLGGQEASQMDGRGPPQGWSMRNLFRHDRRRCNELTVTSCASCNLHLGDEQLLIICKN